MQDFLQLDGLTPFGNYSDTLEVFLVELDRLHLNSSYAPEEMLSPQELERADKFATQQLKNRFVARRWVLRMVLSGYCSLEPHALEFHEGEFGKPYLRDQPIEFSLSHSKGTAAIAIARTGLVGIDVETLPSMDTCREVAATLMTRNEDIGHLLSQENEYRRTFLYYWTLKEAIIKAKGEGLSRNLHEIEFHEVIPEPVLSKLPASYGEFEHWNLNTAYIENRRCMLAVAHRIPAP